MKKRIVDYLLTGIFIITALLTALAALKAYSGVIEKKVAEETDRQNREAVMARNAQAQARVAEMESEILIMSKDVENLQRFIGETETRKETATGNGTVSGDATVSGNKTVSGDATVSGNKTVSGNA
ncbi:MAG: hypothetical protein J1F41_00215, partial [Lachnospiraceae bacterium]|nr:hypothetical protein [Lachnospiraceae bacterium]